MKAPAVTAAMAFLISTTLVAGEVSDGPLLFFTRSEFENRRAEVLYCVDPQQSFTPQKIWSAGVRVNLLSRLTRSTVLLGHAYGTSMAVLNLNTKKVVEVFPGKSLRHLATDDAVVYFYEVIEEPRYLEFGRFSDFRLALYRLDSSEDRDATKLVDWTIANHICATNSDIWVVSEDREVWRIPKNRTPAARVFKLPDHWPKRVRAKFAPNGKSIALSAMVGTDVSDLIVISADRGIAGFQEFGIWVPSNPLSSTRPSLSFRWRTSGVLSFVRSSGKDRDFKAEVVDVDVAQGNEKKVVKVLETIYYYRMYDDEEYTAEIADKWEQTLIQWLAVKELQHAPDFPVLNLNQLKLSSDGHWGAFFSGDRKQTETLFLVDGRSRQQHKVIDGSAYDLNWLPAATQP